MSDPRHDDPMLPEEEDAVEHAPGDVPAGGAGADSGAAETVRIDPDDRAEVPGRSPHNDEPGVGTPDGSSHRDGA